MHDGIRMALAGAASVVLLVLAWLDYDPDLLQVAVASNFRAPAERIVEAFEEETGFSVALSFGSTGRLAAQIRNEELFHVFLAADTARPAQLVGDGDALEGTRTAYSIGRIALWSPDPEFAFDSEEILRTGKFRHLAIANPSLAPYGQAARETIALLGLRDRVKSRLLVGEDVAEAFEVISSGEAELGFVALSQLRANPDSPGSAWIVPASMHRPLVQEAVLLADNEIARAFLEFLTGEKARTMIREYGYDLP